MQERVYLDSAPTRKLLKKYAKGESTEKHYAELLCLLDKCDPPFSHHLKDLVEAVTEDSKFVAPPTWAPLMKALSTPSPVCALIPFSENIHELINRIIQELPIKNDPYCLQQLSENVPLLFHLVMSTKGDNVCPQLRVVLSDLLTLSAMPFHMSAKSSGQTSFTISSNSSTDTAENPIAFFPGLPVQRARGLYLVDKQAQKESSQRKCKKLGKGHRTLLPGIFTIFCQHGELEMFFVTFFSLNILVIRLFLVVHKLNWHISQVL